VGPEPSAASFATGCCTELRLKMLLSLLLVLTRLQLPLPSGVVRISGVQEAGASLLRRLLAGGGVLKLSAPAAAAAAALGLLPAERPSVLDLRSDAAAAALADGLLSMLPRRLPLLLLLLLPACVSPRRRTSPLRLSAAGPETGSLSL
jgi:hypothetical protein